MKLPLCYFEHLDSLRLGHAERRAEADYMLVRLSVLHWTL